MHALVKHRLSSTYISIVLAFAILGGGPHCVAMTRLKILCPGCGTYKMILHMARGEWEAAFSSNAFMFVMLPIFTILLIDYSVRWLCNKPQVIATRLPFFMYVLLYLGFILFSLQRIF